MIHTGRINQKYGNVAKVQIKPENKSSAAGIFCGGILKKIRIRKNNADVSTTTERKSAARKVYSYATMINRK